jgi:hypothetical protein
MDERPAQGTRRQDPDRGSSDRDWNALPRSCPQQPILRTSRLRVAYRNAHSRHQTFDPDGVSLRGYESDGNERIGEFASFQSAPGSYRVYEG